MPQRTSLVAPRQLGKESLLLEAIRAIFDSTISSISKQKRTFLGWVVGGHCGPIILNAYLMLDPVTGIDVTEDGTYVLATCKTYLLLISTALKSESATGFQKSMGDSKQPPKRLQLRPEHVASMGCPVAFTTARFHTGEGGERTIVTSTGPYVVTWNLRRVKSGQLYDYQIKRYPDKIVADNFKYGQDKSIIVTLPHDVTMISKKSLTTPAKLFSPSKGSLRDSVVNSPF